MMLGLLHCAPLRLVSVLDTADSSLKLVNTILKEPARTDAEFRKKLGGLFCELHGIKGEAQALNLKSIAGRVHTLEDMVSECKKKPELSGNDFLPMVLKLDELLAHLRSVREMAARLMALKDTAPGAAAMAAAAGAAAASGADAPERSQPRVVEDLSPTLLAMAERLAAYNSQRFQLTLGRLADVPPSYAATTTHRTLQIRGH